MTQVLPNSSEELLIEVHNNSLVMTEIIVSFWGFCKVLDSNYSGGTTSF